MRWLRPCQRRSGARNFVLVESRHSRHRQSGWVQKYANGAFCVLIFGLAAAGVAACGVSPSSGTVKGVFERVGGPSPGRVPLSGTVRLTGSEGTYAITVGRSGRFASSVPPGTYEVSGRSPQLDGWKPCTIPGSVIQVHSRTVTHAVVVCAIR